MAGARRRTIVFGVLASLFLASGVVVGVSTQRPHAELIILFSLTLVFLVMDLATRSRETNLQDEIRALPFYLINGNYYTFEGQISGVLEQLDPSLVAARIAIDRFFKTIPLPYQASIEIYPGSSPDKGCIKLELTRDGSLQDAFDALGVEGLRNYPLSAQISEALGPLLPLIGHLNNCLLSDEDAEMLMIELCRQLSELGPDILGPYQITNVKHEIGQRTLPDDQRKLWEELSAAAAKPTLCLRQIGWRGEQGFCCQQHQEDEGARSWKPTACSFVNEEAGCPDYRRVEPTI